MATPNASDLLQTWPEESREAAQLVLDSYGEPSEVSDSTLTWYHVGPWKRMVATRTFHEHNFPVPHIDSISSVIDYRVPVEKVGPVVGFDGSVVVERTTGEVLARCHDEQANLLALNLMDDIINDLKTVSEARAAYATEFLNVRRNKPTPYMDKLRFHPQGAGAADPDVRALTDRDLEQASNEAG